MESLPNYLQKHCDILRKAFPFGFQGEEYKVLLYILHPYFSQRALAKLISVCFNKSYAEVLNNLYGIENDNFDSQHIKVIESNLINIGYFEFLKERNLWSN